MEVGPHPHTGLATVTWLLAGEALHHDSLGTEQPLLPGQLNLMTAGRGIAHAELSRPDERFRGVQLWVAQPEATRAGAHAFEHHAELPEVGLGAASGRVLVGQVGDETSPARTDSPLVGVEVTSTGGTATVALEPDFEHCVIPLDATVGVAGTTGVTGPTPAGVGDIVLLGAGADHVEVDAHRGDRWLLLGGEPLEDEIRMWWNFVARSQDELTEAYEAWQARDTDRFGEVDAPLERIDAPRPPWLGPARRQG
jgi:redox-sensitive bicupin YhaK (pirin superfamily)